MTLESTQHDDGFVLIIGSMKSGTTTLYDYLCQHPEIASNELRKEPSFFFQDAEYDKGYEYYRSQWSFDPLRHRVRLEASTDYFKPPALPKVPKRLAEFPYQLRLLCILRDPVHRLESHLAHNLARSRWDPGVVDRAFRYALRVSSYARQLKRYQRLLPNVPVSLHRFEALVATPQLVLDSICQELELTTFVFTPIAPRNVRRQVLDGSTFSLPAELRDQATRALRNDTRSLETDFGFDTSGWSTA